VRFLWQVLVAAGMSSLSETPHTYMTLVVVGYPARNRMGCY
jgi:hypothetical protein